MSERFYGYESNSVRLQYTNELGDSCVQLHFDCVCLLTCFLHFVWLCIYFLHSKLVRRRNCDISLHTSIAPDWGHHSTYHFHSIFITATENFIQKRFRLTKWQKSFNYGLPKNYIETNATNQRNRKF